MSGSTIVVSPARRRSTGRVRVLAGVGWRLVLPVLCLFIVLLVPTDGYLGAAGRTLVLNQAIGRNGFRLGTWEIQALSQKAHDLLVPPGAGLTATQQHDLVIAYFAAVERTQRLNAEIQGVYADPEQRDPAKAAAPLMAELEALRAEQEQRRPAIERILERQVAAVLERQGLTAAGRVLPPIRFQFTESPALLVVSPRDRIAMEDGIQLDPVMPVSQMEQIEGQIADRLDLSALVEGTGGLSSYPTMVISTPDLEWVLSTIAHEWTHTYLIFHPLGRSYFTSGENRTLNETTASIVGDEIARLAMQRFYGDRLPPADWPRPLSMQRGWWQLENEPRLFSFGAFMRETRLNVDKLLGDGKIVQAEQYMEARRKILVARGYLIRKLNQAYFAFHGSYAIGAAATDPIGGKLRALRQRTGSLADFVHTVAKITSVADLDGALLKAGSTPSDRAAPATSPAR